MNLYFKDDQSSDNLVAFFIRCILCEKIIVDYDEFYGGTSDTNRMLCDNHTEQTTHDKFHLGSIVRTFACGDCGESWTFEEEISEWQKMHYRTTRHSFFGFMPITKDMYK